MFKSLVSDIVYDLYYSFSKYLDELMKEWITNCIIQGYEHYSDYYVAWYIFLKSCVVQFVVFL